MKRKVSHSVGSAGIAGLAVVAAAWLGLATCVAAQSSSVPVVQPVTYLTREDAVRQALLNNPLLKTVRHQHGLAEAAVVVARTYPFNPAFTSIVSHNSGPESAGITNRVFTEDYVLLELEVRGQGHYRRAAASAALSRTEWEIAQQEIVLSVAVIRAYNMALYRQKKLEAVEDTIKLNQQAFDTVRRLVDAGKLRAADQLLAAASLEDIRAQRGQVKTAFSVARSDLRRLMGSLDDSFTLLGTLDVPLLSNDQNALTQMALAKRPDLQARQAAVCEAEAALRLVELNRFGNPQIGPLFAIDATQVTQVGGRLTVPLPVFNTKRGEILKAKTDVVKVRSEVQGLELQAAQDVQAALARFFDAKSWSDVYENEVVPNLRKTTREMEKLFTNNDPAADQSRVLAVQRAFLKATETLLDARFEISQAEADLALAVAEPTLALGPAQVYTTNSDPASAKIPPSKGNGPPAISFASPTFLSARALLGQPVSQPEPR